MPYETICRATAKEKSRRTADDLTRLFETAALTFRAAVSLRLYKPMMIQGTR